MTAARRAIETAYTYAVLAVVLGVAAVELVRYVRGASQ
jgi:hypothetical protein